jgi:hypothetical protein
MTPPLKVRPADLARENQGSLLRELQAPTFRRGDHAYDFLTARVGLVEEGSGEGPQIRLRASAGWTWTLCDFYTHFALPIPQPSLQSAFFGATETRQVAQRLACLEERELALALLRGRLAGRHAEPDSLGVRAHDLQTDHRTFLGRDERGFGRRAFGLLQAEPGVEAVSRHRVRLRQSIPLLLRGFLGGAHERAVSDERNEDASDADAWRYDLAHYLHVPSLLEGWRLGEAHSTFLERVLVWALSELQRLRSNPGRPQVDGLRHAHLERRLLAHAARGVVSKLRQVTYRSEGGPA